MTSLEYLHVDVFSSIPYSGNSLPVFLQAEGLSAAQMLKITQELRHFEAIFLESTDQTHTVHARVFDLFEELPFAGHPIIGAAAALHHISGRTEAQTWYFELISKIVSVTTERISGGYFGLLDQGTPEFLNRVELDQYDQFAEIFSLEPNNLHSHLPLQVVSTGLRYLIIPVQAGVLARARISSDIGALLRTVNAQFAVLFDEAAFEIRHWNNDGVLEDSATGSAAGTIGAYCLRYDLVQGGEMFSLSQGRFTGRPSQLWIQPEGTSTAVQTVKVGGAATLVGRGTIEALP